MNTIMKIIIFFTTVTMILFITWQANKIIKLEAAIKVCDGVAEVDADGGGEFETIHDVYDAFDTFYQIKDSTGRFIGIHVPIGGTVVHSKFH